MCKMKLTEIKKIEEILLIDKPLLRHKIGNLAAPAENNGSFLLIVELRLKNEKNFEEKFEVVAKVAVPNGNLQKLESFKNEIAFYTVIIPHLQQFLKLQGVESIDLFSTYYGGRLSLKSRNKATDKDAVFLLENLRSSGFQTLDATKGFDLETTKLILKGLSRFHAVFLAIKAKKPQIFKHEVRPHINYPTDVPDNILVNDTKHLVSLMWENEACVSLIPRIRRAMHQKSSAPREPFATIIHSEFWTNNILVKLENDKPEKIKIIDFQYYNYGSPATDLVFFLFSSVDILVLEDHLDELITFYHENLISSLQTMNCEITSFSAEEFLKEVTTEAKTSQFLHVMRKLNSIFSSQQIQEHKERAWYIVQEFAKRNWI